MNFRFGTPGEVKQVLIGDGDWNPTVPKGSYTINPDQPELGRRIKVKWLPDMGPALNEVVEIPFNKRKRGGYVRATVEPIKGKRLDDVLRMLSSPRIVKPYRPATGSGDGSADLEARRATGIIFARVGAMTYFAGPTAEGERPRGGGSYTRLKLGHEAFNFRNFGGRVYGFAQPQKSGLGGVNLQRVVPELPDYAASLDRVLVVFYCKHGANQHVVGWYRNARIYSERHSYPDAVGQAIKRSIRDAGLGGRTWSTFRGYIFTSAFKDAVLLPTEERESSPRIPGPAQGGPGESNLYYCFEQDGRPRESDWIVKTVRFVDEYERTNLLRDPIAEAHPEDLANIEKEKAGGFQSDPAIRRAIEQHSMKCALRYLNRMGFTQIQDKSKSKPFDFECYRNGRKHYVEVKGTQTIGESVILTRNEVNHLRTHSDSSLLILVRNVEVKAKGKNVSASGGDILRRDPFRILDSKLTASQYTYRVD